MENRELTSNSEENLIIEMTAAQKGQWFLFEVNPDSAFYNNTVTIMINGVVVLPCIKFAINQLVQRHETMRTRYKVINDIPCQVILKHIDCEIAEVDLRELNEIEKAERLQLIHNNEANKAIDICNDNPFRVHIILLENTKIEILFILHHIMSDGWSIKVLLQDLGIIYNDILKYGKSKMEELKLKYSEYSLIENQFFHTEEFDSQLNYWKSKLHGELNRIELPMDKKRNITQSYSGCTKELILYEELINEMKIICTEKNCSMYMIMLSAFVIFLNINTRESDLILGTVIANRDREHLEELIGFFANTIPFRIMVEGNMRFNELLDNVKNNVIEMSDNQQVPFDVLVNELNIRKDSFRNPLFQIMFVYQNSLIESIQVDNCKFDLKLLTNDTSKFDLSVQVFEVENNLSVRFEYNKDIYEESTIIRWQNQYRKIVEEIIKDKNKKISDFDILSEEEKNIILNKFNNTDFEYPSNKTVVELFEKIAESNPQEIAIVHKDRKLTYKELNIKANQLARKLINGGVKTEDCVAIVANKNIETVIGILAILKAGAAYVPLESNYPKERLQYMIQDCKAKAVLVTEEKDFNKDLWTIILHDQDVFEGDGLNIGVQLHPENTSYVMYTSGTTGNPKGVMILHRNIVRLVKNTNFLNFESIKILQAGSLSFDASTFELWGTLLNGGTLYLIDKEDLMDSKIVKEIIDKNKINSLFLTVALFNQLISENDATFDGLDSVLVGGDKLSKLHIEILRRHNKKIKIINGYGPTENTTFTTTYEVGEVVNETIPIGKPIANTKVYVMNGSALCGIGVPGELCTSGDGVARGYLNSPELTEQKFVKNPFGKGKLYRTGDLVKWNKDGNIEFLGRIDEQVKIRGFRIELGEIENAIKQIGNIKDVAVIVKGDIDKILCAYLVSEEKIDLGLIRDILLKELPDYMIPLLMQIDKMPLNKNGKIDKDKLPEIEYARTVEYVVPKNDKEKILVSIYEEVLDINCISIKDSFFELGGDSIKAIRILSKVRNKGYKLELVNILTDNTIEYIADKFLTREKNNEVSQERVNGEVLLTPIQRSFYKWKLCKPYHFNFSIILMTNSFNEKAIIESFDEIVKHHDMLRAVYNDNKQIILDIEINKGYTFYSYNLDYEETERVKEFVENKISIIQQSINLETGPLTKVALFKTEKKDYLFICVHHLVVDSISWDIILEDFIDAYKQAKNGKEIKLPAKTASFKEWANLLVEYSHSNAIKKEYSYWSKICKNIIKIQH